jgi:fused signal recognition particle receptor
MFEGLRKKFSEVIKGFVKKEEQVAEQQAEPVKEEAVPEQKVEEKIEVRQEQPKVQEKVVVREEPKREQKRQETPVVQPKVEKVVEKPKVQTKVEIKSTPVPVQENEIPRAEPKPIVKPAEKRAPEKKEDMIKLSLITKLKKTVFGSVVLSDAEIERFLSGLKVSMLESDVAYDVAESFIGDLNVKLKGKKIESRSINDEVVSSVRQALLDTLNKGASGFNFTERVKQKGEGPFVILFLGPNGTGKTTTIAKIASRLKKEKITTVISASDTFRAAAIEQMEHHANKIGVPIIKSTYGADPASIAFDAVAYARARNLDVVLIDSAGRQETNPSLIREMEKMVRVAKPSMIVFVGESTSGNAIANQIVEFSKHMKIDGIVLTKLDCDAKGGGAISISYLTGIPILFFGVGEGYDALIDYSPEFIADAIVPAAK